MILVSGLAISGCATVKDSLVTGLISGAAIGAGAGAAYNKGDRGKSSAIGALTGATIGGIIGYVTHNKLQERDDKVRRETLFNLDRNNISTPSSYVTDGKHGLTLPIVEGDFIEEHVTEDGKTLIEGHRTWVIKRDSKWAPKSNKSSEK